MESAKPVACWHHGDMEKLRKYLKRGFIDLYGKHELAPKGENRQSRFLKRMRLKQGDRIRIRVGRCVVAYAIIDDNTPIEDENVKRERGCPWGARMMVKDVHYEEPPQLASCWPNFQGSHRFDTKKSSRLSR
jgi:hypothetical protein